MKPCVSPSVKKTALYEPNPNLVTIKNALTTDKSYLAAPVVGYYNPYTSEFINKEILDLALTNPTTKTLEPLIANYSLLRSDDVIEIKNIKLNFKTLGIYILLSEACNFSCPGCAVGCDVKHADVRSLKISEVLVILNSVFESAQQKDFHTVHIKWAGGEPTMPLPFSIILSVQEHIVRLQKQYRIKTVTQSILTNGSYLSSEHFKNCDLSTFHFGVSLWGIGSYNTKARNPKTPNGNFKNIMEGIKFLLDNNASCSLSHVITPFNAKYLPNFVDFLYNPMSQEYIGNYCGANSTGINCGLNYFRPQSQEQYDFLNNKGYSLMLEGTQNAFEKLECLIRAKVPVGQIDRFDYIRLDDISPLVCGSGHNYIAVGPRGYASCHEVLAAETLSLNASKNLLDYINPTNTLNSVSTNLLEESLGDPVENTFLSLHGGAGCPRSKRFAITDAGGPKGGIRNKIYKHIYKDLVYLEFLRSRTAHEH